MIRARRQAGTTVVESSLPRDAVAYVDAEWIPTGGSGDVPALVIHADTTVCFADAWEARAPAGFDPQLTAAWMLASIAATAVAAAERCAPPGPVRVTGRGVVAARSAEILLEHGRVGEGRPAAIIDTTGDPTLIADSLVELVDLGVLVLAGMPPTAMSLDLYPDVHVRGLRIVGAGPLSHRAQAVVKDDASALAPAVFGSTLGEIHQPSGRVTAAGWYRVLAQSPS